ncbi:hypothetical protein TESG_03773 [Trichophyton tonsurans CBS 112818]|uniref:Uncharacterized protein n=1 Tax=Trichophyton tonsurans (strain CBS 112818) TaxID=647933 RepID=F2RYC2_TRIT1|nr:hypothetical protein TESG_03773 [Trichophyton tonsurans CBS 112818]
MASLQLARQADERDVEYFVYLKQMLLKAHRIIESYEPSSEFCVQLHGCIRALPTPPSEEVENNTTTVFETHLPSEPLRDPTGSPVYTTSNPTVQDKAPLEFVLYEPPEDNSATRNGLRWEKELNIFLSNIPETEKWGAPPSRDEILQLLLCRKVRFGSVRLDGGVGGGRDNDEEDDGQTEWDERCRAYAGSTVEAIKIHSAMRGMLAFRVIIVALWVNSRILELRRVGWGDRSAEVFLLYGQSISQFRLICSNKGSGDAFITGIKEKGKPIPKLGDNEILISIPCIVKHYCGKSASLRKVCKVLSYDFREVQPIYKAFYALRQDDSNSESDGPESAAESPSESNISGYEAHTSGSEAPTLPTSPLGTGRETDEPATDLDMPADAVGGQFCANGMNRQPYAGNGCSEYRPSQQRRQCGEEDTEGVDETASATDSSAPSQGGGSIVTGLERQAGSGVEGGFGQQCDSQPRAKRQRTDTTRGGQTSSVSGSVHHSQNTQGQSESNMVGPETTINRGQQANNLSGFQLPLLPSLSVHPSGQHSDYSTQTSNQRTIEPYPHQAASSPTVNVYTNSQSQNQHLVQQTRNTSQTYVARRTFTPVPSSNAQAYNVPLVQGFLAHQTIAMRQTPATHTATIRALLNTNEEAAVNTGVSAPVNSFGRREMPISWGGSQHQRQARQTHGTSHYPQNSLRETDNCYAGPLSSTTNPPFENRNSLSRASTQHRPTREVRGQVECAATTNNPVAIHTAYAEFSGTDYNGQLPNQEV